MSEFDEYIVHGEPVQKEKADVWQTAIGLHVVDGLKVPDYLLDTALLQSDAIISIGYRVDSTRATHFKQGELNKRI